MSCTTPAAVLRHRAGISLLEVLISIGVLSIGLLATLSLMPAGRTYMYKAAIDDRAASIIPAAFETIKTQQMLRVSSLSWTPVTETPVVDVESASAVIRTQGGDPSKVNPNTGRTTPAGWVIEGVDTENITDFYDKDLPPQRITGTVTETPAQSRTVTITSTATTGTGPTPLVTTGPGGSSETDAANGKWAFDIWPLANPTPLPAPHMEIHASGPNVGEPKNEPYTTYSFTATFVNSAGSNATANPSPPEITQFGRRRKVDHRTGEATTTYGSPSNAATTNQTAGAATGISMSTLETAQPAKGRGMVPRTVTKNITDRLWRWKTGTVRNSYEQDVDFANTNNAQPQPRTGVFQDRDIIDDAGVFDGTPTTIQDAEDWYSLPVVEGEIIKIRNDDATWLKTDTTTGVYAPVWFNSTSTQLSPIPPLSDSTAAYYLMPDDGSILTRTQLVDAADNTLVGPPGTPLVARDNPTYSVTIERIRPERVVVFDPLLATRMDKVIDNDDDGDSNSYYLRRHRFADFVQFYASSGKTHRQRIPRLNWYPLTQGSNADTAVAISEYLFRDQDSLGADLSGDPDNAPGPLFDLTTAQTPARRQIAGRMSWLAMLQPVDPGPAALNWTAGRNFNVSLVIFEDRQLPALASPSLSGEYAFDATWNDRDGMLSVQIPAAVGSEDLEDEDVRTLFRTGSWILLAPKVIDDTSPLADTRQLNWHRIQTSRLQKQPGGGVTAALLLESEPAADTLNSSLRNPQTPNESNLVVLAYSGVVAVVNRTVQLEP